VVGRRTGEVVLYFWWSEADNKRKTWFFPSRKEAQKYKDAKWWLFLKYPTLSAFQADRGDSPRQKRIWLSHRDNYLDWKLGTGIGKYSRNFKEREEWIEK